MTDRTCPARYERPGGRERGDRIVKCHLPAGHPGEHEEADTEVTWSHHRLDDMPVGPEPVFGLAPTTGAGLQDWGVLTVEQEIRARALDVAGRKFGSFGYDTEELLDTAERLAAYIRTGRVSAEERSDDTKTSPKIGEGEVLRYNPATGSVVIPDRWTR